MAKYKIEWTEEKYKRFIKEGRGQGEGKDYKPWLTIHDFPSMGRATRIFGWKTQRIHHLFSDLQLRYFYLLDWEDSVIDIREHYPLLDLQESICNGVNNEIGDFVDRKTKVPYVLSTTFLITICNSNGQIQYVARSLKNASQLEKKTTLKRLEAERRYWESKNIDWGIVTNKDINVTRAKNIEWLHSMGNEGIYDGIIDSQYAELADGLLYRFIDSKQPVRRILSKFEEDYGLDRGMGILLFKKLLIDKRVGVDMDKPIDLNILAESLILKHDGKEIKLCSTR